MGAPVGAGVPRQHRLGLRLRLVLAFALGALAVSATVAVLSYGLSREYLLRQREASFVRQGYANARLVGASLRSPEPDVPSLLASVATPGRSHPVLSREGDWFAASLAVGRDALPAGLRERVAAGTPARQLFELGGVPQLAVGVPLAAVDAAYYEAFALGDLERTLGVLRNSLAAAAAVATAAGVAIGRWASGRVLRPLAAAAAAAQTVARGRLDARLDGDPDPDLAALAASFNEMTDALQERIQRDARFASAVSHELRSPLTTLAASVGVLEARRRELPERAGVALDLLAGEVRRFERLVQDLLEISRLDAGGADLACEEVRLADFVRHGLAAGGRRVPLHVEPGAAEAVVEADKRRLAQVLANLLDNAEAYGGGAVRVGVEPAGERVRLVVDDAGPGVPAEERDRIFERFTRGRAAAGRGAGEGTGLGLSLVAEHLRLHGGRAWVEDRPGGGARFVAELPVVPP